MITVRSINGEGKIATDQLNLLEQLPPPLSQFLGFVTGRFGGLSLLLLHFFELLSSLKQAKFNRGHFLVEFFSFGFSVSDALHQPEFQVLERLFNASVINKVSRLMDINDGFTFRSVSSNSCWNLIFSSKAVSSSVVPLKASHSSSNLPKGGRFQTKKKH